MFAARVAWLRMCHAGCLFCPPKARVSFSGISQLVVWIGGNWGFEPRFLVEGKWATPPSAPIRGKLILVLPRQFFARKAKAGLVFYPGTWQAPSSRANLARILPKLGRRSRSRRTGVSWRSPLTSRRLRSRRTFCPKP